MYPFALRMLRVLLEAAPPGASTRKIADALESEVPGVVGVHCLHLWELSPGKSALMAHVHVLTQEKERAEALERALSRATRLLQKKFGINHTTLQMTATPGEGRVGGVRDGGEAAGEVRQVRRAGGCGKRLKLRNTYRLV